MNITLDEPFEGLVSDFQRLPKEADSVLQSSHRGDLVSVSDFHKLQGAIEQRVNVVCRILLPKAEGSHEERHGTGFLIDKGLIMTNQHVLPDEGTCLKSKAVFLYHDAESVTFEVALNPDDFFFRSETTDKDGKEPLTSEKLDFTIVALKTHPGLADLYRDCFSLDQLGNPKNGGMATIIQHPCKHDLTSLKDSYKRIAYRLNQITLIDKRLFIMHYTTSTLPGSSGAPVMDDQGRLLGLHRSACPTFFKKNETERHQDCNTAILISSIYNHLESLEELKKIRERPMPFSSSQHPISVNKTISIVANLPSPPLPPTNFTGREKELQDLHEAFNSSNCVAITGLGGKGKTALALKYAKEYESDYLFIYRITAGTPQLIIKSLLELADYLDVAKTENVEDRLSWLKITLDRMSKEKKYLLFFDGIDQTEALREFDKRFGSEKENKKNYLLTSRRDLQCMVRTPKVINLEELDLGNSKKYLLEATSSNDDAEATDLAEKLKGLPLALTHAARFIITRRITIENYNDQFNKYKLSLFEPRRVITLNGEETILTTWNISISEIANEHPLAKEILEFFAFLGQAPIPRELIENWFKEAYPKALILQLDDALNSLRDYSMIEDIGGSYSIHSLVQKVIRFNRNEGVENKQIIQKIFETCYIIAKKTPRLSLMITHFKSILRRLEKAKLEDWQFSHWFDFLGIIWKCDYEAGHYQDAEQMAIKRLRASQKEKEKGDSLNMLGKTLGELKKYQEALEYHKKALTIREKEGWLEDVAVSKNNIGCMLEMLKEYEKAIKYHEEVLEYRIIFCGEDSLDMATTKNNIGCVLNNMGKPREALKYHKEALAIRKEKLGERSLDVAISLNNLGYTYSTMSIYQDSIISHLEALDIRKEKLGENHLDVATSLFNLGCAYHAMRDYEKALLYHQNALTIRECILGPEHPDVQNSRDLLNSSKACQLPSNGQ